MNDTTCAAFPKAPATSPRSVITRSCAVPDRIVPNLAEARQRALDAGARELMPPVYVSSGFGTRDVAFLQSPGGILFEFAQIHEHKVPVLP